MEDLARAIAMLEGHRDEDLAALVELARIPSVSAEGFDPQEVVRSAERVAALLREAGLPVVEVLRHGDAPPYVFAEWRASPDRPTVLLYAHHDVQPPGRDSAWRTPPFQPTLVGGRLWGRGVADDKAGVLVHVAALGAWLRSAGRVPVNVRVLIEGEEEVGSPHLASFLRAQVDRLRSQVICLTDTANLDAGVPSLTYRLRGLVGADVEARTVDHPIHSGMWGGPAVDAPLVLARVLARLVDSAGRIAIPEVYDRVRELDAGERARLAALPFDETHFRAQAGIPPAMALGGEPGRGVYERLWCRPAIAVTALEARDLLGSTNQIVESARARVSMRIVPDMDPEGSLAALCRFLEADPPWGARLTVTPHVAAPPWVTEPSGPAFRAAERALAAAFGRPVAYIGCGGTIPFVGPFAAAFDGAPCLLLGLEDPECNAHGENEGLLLEDWRRLMEGEVRLLAELARI